MTHSASDAHFEDLIDLLSIDGPTQADASRAQEANTEAEGGEESHHPQNMEVRDTDVDAGQDVSGPSTDHQAQGQLKAAVNISREEVDEEDEEEAEEEAQAVVQDLTQTAQKRRGEIYQEAWLDAKTRVEAAERDLEQLLHGLESRFQNLYLRHRLDGEELLRTIADRLQDRMVSVAQRSFAPFGASLTIDLPKDLAGAYGGEYRPRHYKEWADSIDFTKVWDWIEDKYGGDSARNIANKQLCKRLVDSFDIRPHLAPEFTKRNELCLSVSMYMCSIFKEEYVTGRESEAIGAVLALAEFAAVEDLYEMSVELRSLVGRWHNRLNRLLPGQSHDLEQLKIRTFRKNIKFTLSPNASAKFLAFIARHHGQ